MAKSPAGEGGVAEALAELGHDLREPLAAIAVAASAMEARVFGPLDERYADHARLIGESARHLLAMAEDLLALAGREPRGRARAPAEPIAEARWVARLMAPLAAESGVVLRFHASGSSAVSYGGGGPPPGPAIGRPEDRLRGGGGGDSAPRPPPSPPSGVLPPLAGGDDPACDAVAIRRILINLLANALAHTPAGGEVIVEASATELAVRDTGPGFEANAPEGLGLPIVRRLCAEMGATFAIGPGDGGGTRAVVRFGAAR